MFSNPAYPTYQAFLALGLAALVVLLVMPLWIRLLKHEGIGQQVRADGPQRHLIKQGTPTMGGVVILLGVVVSCLLIGRVTHQVLLAGGVALATGGLGLFDDVTKVVQGRSLGLTPTAKMVGLTLIVIAFFVIAVNFCGVEPLISFPGGFALDLGVLTSTFSIANTTISIPWLYLVFVFLLLAGMSNAVNLTDGLDGLAGGTVMIAMLVMSAICFLSGDASLAVFCCACAGGCLGFLWFNAYPASIFMGDTGSLALGAGFAGVAILTNTEVVSLVVGALFIVEALSVIVQVVSFKSTGKRIFLMAPIHHHFEKLGWAETKVVIRFWIVSAACGALGLACFFQLG
ncbi:MAG: phospho-N-acetylmuramoyl-pentapeptide-transferase [Collinsella sp.]|nr:phospho-N-acetylmuramoyl-pentapeptide-transferase [Collinsella sp.]